MVMCVVRSQRIASDIPTCVDCWLASGFGFRYCCCIRYLVGSGPQRSLWLLGTFGALLEAPDYLEEESSLQRNLAHGSLPPPMECLPGDLRGIREWLIFPGLFLRG